MRKDFEAQMEQLKSDYEYKLNAMRQRIKDLETDATVRGHWKNIHFILAIVILMELFRNEKKLMRKSFKEEMLQRYIYLVYIHACY
jgi:hypothetical protein